MGSIVPSIAIKKRVWIGRPKLKYVTVPPPIQLSPKNIAIHRIGIRVKVMDGEMEPLHVLGIEARI